jgi:hypothetical protein
MMLPLANVMVSCGKFLGQNNSLRLAPLPTEYSSTGSKHRNTAALSGSGHSLMSSASSSGYSSGMQIARAKADDRSSLKEDSVSEVVLLAEDSQAAQKWLVWLTQCIRLSTSDTLDGKCYCCLHTIQAQYVCFQLHSSVVVITS